ncbi:MAG: palindromic element RPE1 domain-containing protein [Gammaproteobacteria bacterium]|nr:palindromic element RPE1 domain-containing protein [Gammaproteobacteria bacterium]
MRGRTARRTAAYMRIREDSSTGLTKQSRKKRASRGIHYC